MVFSAKRLLEHIEAHTVCSQRDSKPTGQTPAKNGVACRKLEKCKISKKNTKKKENIWY